MTGLPEGWAAATLEDVAIWGSGGTPNRNRADYFGGSIPWIKTGELGEKYVHSSEETLTDLGLASSSAKVFPRGSVAIAMYGATIGKLSIWGIDAATNQACAVAQPKLEAISTLFLYYFLQSEKRDLVAAGKGGAQPNISQGLIREWPLPLPPFPEQHRIVAKIEELFSELDAGTASLTRARAQLKTYRQALLKAAFEGKLTAPWRVANPDKLESPETLLSRIRKERDARYAAALDNWQTALSEWRAGGEAGRKPGKPSRPTEIGQAKLDSQEKVTGWLTLPLGGLAYRADLGKMLDQVKNKGSHRPYFGNINLRWGAFNIDERKTIPIEDHEVERYGICKGDLVICEGGEPGRCAVWLGQDNQYFIQKALHRVRFTGAYLPFFAYYFMTYAALSGILEEFFTGSTIKHLTASSLADVPFPICSTEEQREIVDILDAKLSSVDAIDTEITAALTRIAALRLSILKKAFSGQLVVQDHADEPASAVLARLAQAPAPKPRRKTAK